MITPLLRIEGSASMQRFCNVLRAVVLGFGYAVLCVVLVRFLRMILMEVPPLALTGAIFSTALSGILSK